MAEGGAVGQAGGHVAEVVDSRHPVGVVDALEEVAAPLSRQSPWVLNHFLLRIEWLLRNPLFESTRRDLHFKIPRE